VRAGERLISVGDRLSLAELNDLTYEPAFFPGSMGTFGYEVRDGRGGATGGSVDISVTRPNRAPLAFDEPTLVVIARAQAPLSLRQPVDPDGDPLTIVVTDIPSAGTVTVGDRRIETGDQLTSRELEVLDFRAGDAPAGPAGRFAYMAEDPDGGTASAGRAIEIAPPNRNPVVAGAATVVAVTGGDPVLMVPQLPEDPDGDPLARAGRAGAERRCRGVARASPARRRYAESRRLGVHNVPARGRFQRPGRAVSVRGARRSGRPGDCRR